MATGSIDRLPLYIRPEAAVGRRRSRYRRERHRLVAISTVLVFEALVALASGLVFRDRPGPSVTLLSLAVGLASAIGVGLGGRALRRSRRARRGPLPSVACSIGWPGSRPLIPRVRALLNGTAILVVLTFDTVLPRLAGPEAALVSAGLWGGAGLVAAIALVQLCRDEDRSGWWLLHRHRHDRGPRRVRTYAGDGLVVPELGWRITLAAPLADGDASGFPRLVQWGALMAIGRHEAALALAARTYTADDATWAGWAALSALALGRVDDAEGWVQRAVDDGYRGAVDRRVARALTPLHGTAAWRALRRQTT
jgi:hypothetical protein